MNPTPLFLAVLCTLPSALAPQEPAPQDEPPAPTLTNVNPEARAQWERLIAASRTATEDGGPITTFVLQADVGFRGEGVQRNDAIVDYRFLAPHFIRFKLSATRETGRGPGLGHKAYWLRDDEKVVELVGRDFREDRRQIDEMLSIAKNFIALSDPARIRLTKLELLPAPPTGLPRALNRIARRKVDWIRVASADFALVQGQLARGEEKPPTFLVDIGLSRDNDLPLLAIIREEKPRSAGGQIQSAQPMLIRLEDWRAQDGFQVPWKIQVHRLDPLQQFRAFEELPAQDIVLMEASLRPELTEADFEPR